MIGPNFTFDFEQRRALERLKLNDRQIDTLEYFVPLCAMYLQSYETADLEYMRPIFDAALKNVTAVRDFITPDHHSIEAFEALHAVAAIMGYDKLQELNHLLAQLQAATIQAPEQRKAAGRKPKHSLIPLALIHIALHTGSAALDAPLHEVMTALPTEGLENSRFRPSQSPTGPFAKVAHAIYQLIAGTDCPEKALRQFSVEVTRRQKATSC